MVAAAISFPTIPDKLYFRIGEVAHIAGIPTSVLRFWENEFSAVRPQRTEAGQRLYRKSDVELILTIKHLLYEKKFTIKGARLYLRKQMKAARPLHREDFLAQMRHELEQIRRLLE
jgi:DNA-binding transcriptional MerR regulator